MYVYLPNIYFCLVPRIIDYILNSTEPTKGSTFLNVIRKNNVTYPKPKEIFESV